LRRVADEAIDGRQNRVLQHLGGALATASCRLQQPLDLEQLPTPFCASLMPSVYNTTRPSSATVAVAQVASRWMPSGMPVLRSSAGSARGYYRS
jgi:hypothetical protein